MPKYGHFSTKYVRLYHPDQNKLPSKSESKVCRIIKTGGVKSITWAQNCWEQKKWYFRKPAQRLSQKKLYEYLLKDVKCTESTCNTTIHISSKGRSNKSF